MILYSAVVVTLIILLAGYVAYQRFFHPLAHFSGPLAASLTNAWKAYHTYQLQLHERLIELHLVYGSVVRIGPNDLHFWHPNAISIYKAGRSMGKTEFYDAFTTFNPNLFGTKDDNIHAIRRRQLAHGFSQVSINEMEYIIDGELNILRNKLRGFAKTGEPFDLKEAISCYVLDILGEAAFSRSFNTQSLFDQLGTHAAINDHILLACVIGQMPFQGISKKLVAWSPLLWMRRLVKSRAQLKATCADCVRQRMEAPPGRKDLLRSLIDAKDPETGERLEEVDINTEAFAMLVAGSHTTAGTLSLLFWHLLNNSACLGKVVSELDRELPSIGDGENPFHIEGLKAKLPYTMACISENFRMNSVFTMTLWRRVREREGVEIDGYHVPAGTNVCAVNHAMHHNSNVWGDDHNVFDPSRWFDERAQDKEGFLQHFSAGHRMCIGKNLAMTNIIKTVATLLKTFEFESVMGDTPLRFRSSGIGEMEGRLLCKVKLRC